MIVPRKKAGLSLVEVIIASAIVLVLAVVLVAANLAYLKTADSNLQSIKATYLIEEGIEAVNYLKNINWSNLGAVNTNYYLVWTGTTWQATTTPVAIDQTYSRKFSTAEVNRNSDKDIVTVGGTLDENTRLLTVQVFWLGSSGTTTKAISAYLMKNND